MLAAGRNGHGQRGLARSFGRDDEGPSLSLPGLHTLIVGLQTTVTSLSAQLTTANTRIEQLESLVRDNAQKAANTIKASVAVKLQDLGEKVTATITRHHELEAKVKSLTSAKIDQGSTLRNVQGTVTKLSGQSPLSHSPPSNNPKITQSTGCDNREG